MTDVADTIYFVAKSRGISNYFFSNLLLGQKHILKNREMHVQFEDTVNDTVLYLIKQNNKITTTEICGKLNISLSTTKRRLKRLKESGK